VQWTRRLPPPEAVEHQEPIRLFLFTAQPEVLSKKGLHFGTGAVEGKAAGVIQLQRGTHQPEHACTNTLALLCSVHEHVQAALCVQLCVVRPLLRT